MKTCDLKKGRKITLMIVSILMIVSFVFLTLKFRGHKHKFLMSLSLFLKKKYYLHKEIRFCNE